MFLLSIILILLSSYFITSCLMMKGNRRNTGFLYLLLISFSQIILSFEILSILSAISKNNFIIINFIFFISTLILWIKSEKPKYKPLLVEELKKIIKSLKRDKLLFFIAMCFIVFILSELFISLFFPITFGDALKYTFPRCTTWIQNANINHFITPDTRELIMPINLELLYTWFFLFLKKEIGTAIFSFIAYISTIYLIYNFLGELRFSKRKRLWAIFTFSSFALVGVMTYTPCSDLFLGALILSSTYLFYIYCKTDNKIPLYFSSLAYALAIGTKTTAIMMIPATSIIFLTLLVLHKKELKKTIIYFTTILLVNFLIFSAYNYILNFIQYGNFITDKEQYLIHKFNGGFKGFLCNLIKYCFISLDTSGIPLLSGFNQITTNIQTLVLNIIGETPNSYMSPFFKDNFKFNSTMTISTCALGVIGILAFIPSIFISISKMIKKSKKRIILFILMLSLVINIICISMTMLFSQYNNRYLMAFIVLASPILVYSYIKSNKNIYKWIVCFFMFIYLLGIPHSKPISFIIKWVNTPNVENKYEKVVGINRDELTINKYLSTKKVKYIALITNTDKQALFDIEKLKLQNIKIDKLLVENIEEYDLSKYEYIVTDLYKTESNYITKYNSKEDIISKNLCLYIDEKAQFIENQATSKPVKVVCEIPYNYLMKKGFNPIDIGLKNYSLLAINKNK